MSPEAIMICLDTSSWMEGTNSPMFWEQTEAIINYCKDKFESHDQNVVGLCGMSESYFFHMIYPTRNLSQIKAAVNAVRIGGYLMVTDAIALADCVWIGSLDTSLQKRIVVFAGGPVITASLDDMTAVGQSLKKSNLACDVVNFGDQYVRHRLLRKKDIFKALIDHADSNGNCHICHVPPELSLWEALSRSQIITPRVVGSGSTPEPYAIPSLHDNVVVICVKADPNAPDALGDCPFCQRVLLTLKLKDVAYDTHFINLDNKPDWFVQLNPDGILPFIKFGGKWYSNSDDIVEMIDEKYPSHPLPTSPLFASVGFKILPKVLKFLKSDDDNCWMKEALLEELDELEGHLSENGPYFYGGAIAAADLSLAPKLYHLIVALPHFKGWNVPQKLTHVHEYIKLLVLDWELFQKTKPSEECVIAGWKLKINS